VTQYVSLPSSAGVGGPGSRGWVPSEDVPVGEGVDQAGSGRKFKGMESTLSGQLVPTGPAGRAPLGAQVRRKDG